MSLWGHRFVISFPSRIGAELRPLKCLAWVRQWAGRKPSDPLFLDVQMPKMGGFDVIEKLRLRQLPPTAFVDGLS
jgi:CheY-like chemotaxis protein